MAGIERNEVDRDKVVREENRTERMRRLLFPTFTVT